MKEIFFLVFNFRQQFTISSIFIFLSRLVSMHVVNSSLIIQSSKNGVRNTNRSFVMIYCSCYLHRDVQDASIKQRNKIILFNCTWIIVTQILLLLFDTTCSPSQWWGKYCMFLFCLILFMFFRFSTKLQSTSTTKVKRERKRGRRKEKEKNYRFHGLNGWLFLSLRFSLFAPLNLEIKWLS